MSRPRVFISHSAKEPATEQLLDKLAAALNRKVDGTCQYELLLDKDGLSLGDYWRSTLNLWIGGCDVAIVLLSPSALQSSFVAYELSILSYRYGVDRNNFRLLPVFVDPVTEAEVNASPLIPTQITEVQGATALIAEATHDAVVAKVLQGLEGLKRSSSPVEPQARALSRLLRCVGEHNLDVLREEAERLDIDLGTWVPAEEIALTLAHKMIGAGLEKSRDIIRRIRRLYSKGSRAESVGEIINLVASSWVDHRATELIPVIADNRKLASTPAGQKTKLALAINGEQHLTATMYVSVAALRSKGLPMTDSWSIAEVDGIMGEASFEDLTKSIQAALRYKLAMGDNDDFNKELKILTDREPCFVSLPGKGINASLLQRLEKPFPGVTFFLLCGNEPPDQSVFDGAGVEMIEPKLEANSEKLFCDSYVAERKYLFKAIRNE